MPYQWINNVLVGLGLVALLAALACLAVAILRGKGKRKRAFLAAGCCLVAFLLLGAANYACIFWVQLPALGRQMQQANRERRQQAQQNRTDTGSLIKVGDQAPEFRIRAIDGSEFSLHESRGKVVLVNFFATWCGPCLKELPHMQKLWKEHGDHRDFALLVIGREESEATVRAFLTKHGYSFPAAADPDRLVYSRYAKELIPRTYLIGRDGTICYAATGFYEEDVQALQRELARQLDAKQPGIQNRGR